MKQTAIRLLGEWVAPQKKGFSSQMIHTKAVDPGVFVRTQTKAMGTNMKPKADYTYILKMTWGNIDEHYERV